MYLKRGNSPGMNWGSYENGEGQLVTKKIGHFSKKTALLSDFNMGHFRRCEKGYSSEIFFLKKKRGAYQKEKGHLLQRKMDIIIKSKGARVKMKEGTKS